MLAKSLFLALSPPPRPLRAASVAYPPQHARHRRLLSLRCCAARAAGEIADDETPVASSSATTSTTTATTSTTAQRRRRRTKPTPPPPPTTCAPSHSSPSASVSQKAKKGADATAILWLEFEEAALGCVKEVSLFVRRPCRGCIGAGTAGGAAPVPCERCRGKGKVEISRTAGFRRVGIGGREEGRGRRRSRRSETTEGEGEEEEQEKEEEGGKAATEPSPSLLSSPSSSPSPSPSSSCCCPLCQGSGKSSSNLWCPDCGGEGSVEVSEETRVRVPAGASDATALRIRGAGHSAPARAPARLKGALLLRSEEEEGEEGAPTTTRGDAYILCCVAAAATQREWSRRGLDVVAPLSLSPFDAVLGVPALPVRTLRGLRRLEVPSGTQHGDELVLKGEGAGGGGGRGGGGRGGGGGGGGGVSSSVQASPSPSPRSSRSSSAAAAAATSAAGDHVLVVRLTVPEKVSSSDRDLLLRLREIALRV